MDKSAIKYKNIISGMDTKTYLMMLNELDKYLSEYFLDYKGIKCKSFNVIGISYFDTTPPIYKIQIDFFNIDYKDQIMDISGNVTMTVEEFKIFYRIIKIKKIKNEKYIKCNKRK